MCRKKRNNPYSLVNERLKELTATSELSTSQYTVVKIVKAEDPLQNLGDRKILYSCNIYIKAGINLEEYDSSKTIVDKEKSTITLVLPHAKILSFNMPSEEQTLCYEKISITRKRFKAGDRNNLLIQGEESVRSQVENMGILADAERNTKDIFRAALMQLGFQTININFE